MSSERESSRIEIVFEEMEAQTGTKGFGRITERIVKKVGILNTDQLGNNLAAFCKQIGQMFEGISTSVRDYELDSFELAIEVTATGGIRFIGSASTDVKGGLKLVFNRQRRETSQ